MRIRDAATVALLLVLAAGGGANAQGKKDGEVGGGHKYAGDVCFWTAHKMNRSISMSYKGLNGEISVREKLESFAGGGFTWEVMPGSGAEKGVIGQAALAGDALDGLCGALLRAHDRAIQRAGYDPDKAFRELLAAALKPTR